MTSPALGLAVDRIDHGCYVVSEEVVKGLSCGKNLHHSKYNNFPLISLFPLMNICLSLYICRYIRTHTYIYTAFRFNHSVPLRIILIFYCH